MDFYFNSHKIKYRKPFGAVNLSSEVELTVYAPPECSAVSLQAFNGSGYECLKEMKKGEDGYFRTSFTTPDAACLVYYYFILNLEDGSTYYYGNNEERLGGEGRIYVEDPVPYQITVYEDSNVPEWYKNAVVYQIFPDRFAIGGYKNEDYPEDWYELPNYEQGEDGIIWKFYGGDIKGVTEKLPYLKSLGVTCIYFNPIFEAKTNHRYDVCDYFVIDERFGNDEEFDAFIAASKRFGIRVILDGVFNHSGKDSRYCREHPDWYSGEYWWGVKDLPEFDDQSREYRDFICGENGVVRYWIRRGISGWRLDVVDELPDDFVKEIRAAAKAEDPDAVIIGEVWEDASNKYSHDQNREYFFGKELDGVMNYPLRELFLDFSMFRCSSKDAMRRYMSLAENYPSANLRASFNLLDSHDRERALTLLGGKEHSWYALRRLKYGLALQYALPGTPTIYYGDEAEMYGGKDPENRGAFPWGRENQELTDYYRLLGQIYKDHPVLSNGNFTPVYDFGDEIFAFLLEREEKILVLVNRNDDPIHIEYGFGGNYALELIDSKEQIIEDGVLKTDIPGLSAAYILLMDEKPVSLTLPRGAGILCHITSIPGGTLGEPAKRFVDFIKDAGFKYWQVLPINPVGMGDSPYMSPDVFGIDERLGTFEELAELKEYANSKGIKLIGDLPIYVAPQGEDVKRDPLAFQQGRHAGCPPDYFTPLGQDWGNPLYDWEYIKETGYEWWIRRIRKALKYFDYVRIDHFRGFAAYFSIPNEGSPKDGYWMPGPGIDMFRTIKDVLSEDGSPLPIIAEDLGFLDAQVYNLMKLTGFPGLNVWQTDLEVMKKQSPAERRHRVYYPGTHDSDTLVGWYIGQDMEREEAQAAAEDAIEKLYASEAGWVIVTLQDMLGLDSSARMNIPGTAEGNWQWKVSADDLTPQLAEKYRKLAEKYCR